MPVGHGGPEMAPKPPFARRAPAEPWRASITVAGDGAPRWPPNPPSLVAPRRSRGAPRSQSQVMGPRDAPKPPFARRAPVEPWRSSITLLSLSAQHRAQQEMRGDVDEQRKEDEHAGE